MSLVVNIFYIDDESGQYIEADLTLIEPGKELAGLERWRTEVYGSSVIKYLGAKFLPQLSRQDLWVENKQLDDFETEIKLLLNNISLIAKETGYSYLSIEYRFKNILEAAIRAKSNSAGVIIS